MRANNEEDLYLKFNEGVLTEQRTVVNEPPVSYEEFQKQSLERMIAMSKK